MMHAIIIGCSGATPMNLTVRKKENQNNNDEKINTLSLTLEGCDK